VNRLLAAVLLLAAPLTADWCVAQDALSDANEAFRRSDFKIAAKLFSEAAAAESDAGKRAEIRVRLAVTYFNLGSRTKAEEALGAALADQPQLELVADFYADEFLSLFKRVRARRTAAAQPAPAPTPLGPGPAVPASLAGLRQRLALAVDNPALDDLLAEVRQLEMATPPPLLADVLEIESDVLERLGQVEPALEDRGRAAAIRASVQALPGTTPVPLDALLEARRLLAGSRAVEAAALSRGILAALPSCAPALEVLAEALLDAGRLDEAYSALRTALSDREKPELLLLLGEVELRRGRLPNARDAFRKAADAEPGNDRASAALGMVAAKLGDLDTAREALDRALQANGTLVEARVLRAEIALERGEPSVAVQHLQRALQMRPDDPWASGWLGVAYLFTGNPVAAVDALDRARDLPSGTFALARAEALRRLGRSSDALAILEKAPHGDVQSLLTARCLLDAGRDADAAAALQALADRQPDGGSARYLLGCALHRQRDWARSSEELTRAATLPGAPATTRQAVALVEATLAAQRLLDGAQTPPPLPVKK
jgi:tetratricopeptide (TPR) repeat protein